LSSSPENLSTKGLDKKTENLRSMEWKNTLMKRTIQELLNKQSGLFEQGAIGLSNSDDLRTKVESLFKLLRSTYKEIAIARSQGKPCNRLLEELHQTSSYQEIIRLMVFAGTLTPIIAEDWSIRRLNKIKESLGVRSINKLKQIMAKQLAPDDFDFSSEESQGVVCHLDKGGGNGSFMNNQRFQPKEKINNVDISTVWRGISTGFSLHHDPTDIIDNFLTEEAKNDPKFQKFLVALKHLVKKYLKAAWFIRESNQAGIREHRPTVDLFDNNMLFVALWNLNPKTKLAIAKEFAKEVEIPLDQETFAFFQAFLGISKEKIETNVKKRAYDILKQRKANLKKEKRKFAEVKAIFNENKIISIQEVFRSIKEKYFSELDTIAEQIINNKTQNFQIVLKRLSSLSTQCFKENGRLVDIRSISKKIEEGELIDISQIRTQLQVGTPNLKLIAQKIQEGKVIDLRKINELSKSTKEKQADFIRLGSIFKKIQSINKTERPKNRSAAIEYIDNRILFFQEELNCMEQLISSESGCGERQQSAQQYSNFLVQKKIKPLVKLKTKIKKVDNFDPAIFYYGINNIEELPVEANSLEQIDAFLDKKLKSQEDTLTLADALLKDIRHEKTFDKKNIKNTKNKHKALTLKLKNLTNIEKQLRQRTYGDDISDILEQVKQETGIEIESQNALQDIKNFAQSTQQEISFIDKNFTLAQLSKKITILKKAIQALSTNNKNKIFSSIKQKIKISERETPDTKEQTKTLFQSILETSLQEAKKTKMEIKSFSPDDNLDNETERKNRINFFKKYFDPKFVDTLLSFEHKGKNGESLFKLQNGELDLNKYCHTFPYNFVPSEFVNLDKVFSSNYFALITSVRSDSHESTTDFTKDILGNLKLLQPGGVLLIDGFKESYSRIYRLEEIQNLLSTPNLQGKYKIKVILEQETNTPKSVIIQKISKNVRLNLDDLENNTSELRSCFEHNVYFQNIKETLERIDLNLLNIARKLIKNSSKQGVDLIKTVTHEKIEEIVRNILLNHAHIHWDKLDNFFENEKILDSIFKGEIKIRNLNQSEWEILTDQVNNEINQIIQEIRERVSNVILVSKSYSQDLNHLFTNKNITQSDATNQPKSFKPDQLPTGEFFTSPEFKEGLERTIQRVILNLKKTNIKKPLIIPTFDNCATNQMISKLLKKMGLKQFVKFQAFRENMRDTTFARIMDQEMRGILVGGGSHHDTYKPSGSFFQEKVGRPLLTKLEDPKYPLFGFPVCFLYQLFIALLNKNAGKNERVVAGALEFGPSSARVINKNHPLFRNCFPKNEEASKPLLLSVSETRSGHLLDTPQEILEGITPLAVNPLTKKVLSYETKNGGIIGIQWHPEIRSLTDFQKIAKEIGDNTLGKIFGIKIKTIMRNPQNACPNIKGDSNMMVFANALEILSKRLCTSLDSSTKN